MYQKLRQLVEDAGLTQSELAARLEMSEPTVSRLLSGQRGIKVEEAEAVLAVLRETTGRRRGLTLNDLVDAGRAA